MAAILNNVKLMQETSVVHPHRTTAYHGETVNFSIDFRSYGAQVDLTGATAALYWRVPSDEEGYWHQATASCSGSTAAWTWDATMDNGESPATWFLKVDADDSNDTTSYRATGELTLLASPGFVPAVVPPAHATLDFDLINVLHAPYYTQAETDTAIANAIADIPPPAYPVVSVNGKTGAVELSASDVGAATTQYVDNGLAGKVSGTETSTYIVLPEGKAFGVRGSIDTGPSTQVNIGTNGWFSSRTVSWQDINFEINGSIPSVVALPVNKDGTIALVEDIPAVPVKSVKVNGTALTPDAQGAVDVSVPAVSAETWTFTLSGGGTVTKSVAVY